MRSAAYCMDHRPLLRRWCGRLVVAVQIVECTCNGGWATTPAQASYPLSPSPTRIKAQLSERRYVADAAADCVDEQHGVLVQSRPRRAKLR